ncbi:MAG: hypothetical protein R3Y15_04140 [Rikenellaceae bacterium]
MNQTITLTDKWQFIGAEEYIGSQWQKATLVNGMSYVYSKKDSLLKVEIFTDSVFGDNDNSEADLYKVTLQDSKTAASPIIKLSILGQEDRWQPLVRYTLQKVYDLQ